MRDVRVALYCSPLRVLVRAKKTRHPPKPAYVCWRPHGGKRYAWNLRKMTGAKTACVLSSGPRRDSRVSGG